MSGMFLAIGMMLICWSRSICKMVAVKLDEVLRPEWVSPPH